MVERFWSCCCIFLAAVIFLAVILIANTAFSATLYWSGTVSSDWNNSNNWDDAADLSSPGGSGIPQTGDVVVIYRRNNIAVVPAGGTNPLSEIRFNTVNQAQAGATMAQIWCADAVNMQANGLIVLESGGTHQARFTGGRIVSPGALRFENLNNTSAGAIMAIGSGITSGGAISFDSASTINYFYVVLDINDGGNGLTINNTDTDVRLSGANAQLTGTITNNGILRLLSSANVLGTGATPLIFGSDNSELHLGPAIDAAAWTRPVTVNGNATIFASNNPCEIDTGISIAATKTLTFDDQGTLTCSGVISGAGSVTVNMTNPANTITFSGNNTYDGLTTITSGTLNINGVMGDANDGGITVANNATLGGTGTLKSDVTVLSGGIVSPGVGGIGTLTTAAGTASNGNIDFQGTSRLVVDVNAATKDLLAVGGNLSLPIGTSVLAIGTSNFDTANSPYQVVTVAGTYDNSGNREFQASGLPVNWSVLSTADTEVLLNYVAPPPAAIPTLSEWGMIIFSVLLGTIAIWTMNRRKDQMI